jgi:hypothetical protein
MIDKITDESGLRVIGKEEATKLKNMKEKESTEQTTAKDEDK